MFSAFSYFSWVFFFLFFVSALLLSVLASFDGVGRERGAGKLEQVFMSK